jgi:septal ring factor EnvC (AmiA/AmiB activator)
MKRLTFLPIVLWAATGCGSKIIDRLDCANYQLDQINCQLVKANEKLDTANKNLTEGNKIATKNGEKLDTANKNIEGTNARLDDANKGIKAVESEVAKSTKQLDDANGALGKIAKTTGDIDTKVEKNGVNMQKGFDELIKRSPPPKN